MQPNLFSIATKELSQDSFFTWLLRWADNSCHQTNPNLNETAKDFVRMLIGEHPDYAVVKVEANRQWKNIDVWAEINDEYFLAIEDKTNTGEHSEQLEHYKQSVFEYYNPRKFKLAFAYLKTGNESLSSLKKIEAKGYKIIDRKSILDILNRRDVQNDIFSDFQHYLTSIETSTNSYTKFDNIISDWKAAEGFYLTLQQELVTEETHWEYVPNQSGGFLGFWYHWVQMGSYNLYIQIENAFERGIKVVIKIGEWEPDNDTLHAAYLELQSYATDYGLVLKKPKRFRARTTSTVAVIENAFQTDEHNNLILQNFITVLFNAQRMLNDISQNKQS